MCACTCVAILARRSVGIEMLLHFFDEDDQRLSTVVFEVRITAPRTVLAKTIEANVQAHAANRKIKLRHQGELRNNYYMAGSEHDGDHDGVVRIS